MDKMKRSDIKLLVQPGHYAPDVDWGYFVESWITDHPARQSSLLESAY
jgi:hypothetical protein